MTSLTNTFSSAAPALVSGLVLSFGLIVAIGAQNAFVLRQGLRREHVGSVVLFCALADVVLIAAGVFGMAQAIGQHPDLARALALAGAVFLAAYGWQALKRAQQFHQLRAEVSGSGSRLAGTLAQAAAFTLLNPHVYLDTVVLMGSISAQYAPYGWAFGIAAACGSLTFFAALGFGARLLAPVFARPQAWVVLEVVVGVTMWAIAAALVFG